VEGLHSAAKVSAVSQKYRRNLNAKKKLAFFVLCPNSFQNSNLRPLLHPKKGLPLSLDETQHKLTVHSHLGWNGIKNFGGVGNNSHASDSKSLNSCPSICLYVGGWHMGKRCVSSINHIHTRILYLEMARFPNGVPQQRPNPLIQNVIQNPRVGERMTTNGSGNGKRKIVETKPKYLTTKMKKEVEEIHRRNKGRKKWKKR
jgi:hypothetical protein